MKPISVFCAGLLSGLWSAQTAYAADLTEIHRLAEQNDKVYAAARYSWQAGQEKLPQGRALLLPSVTATANSTRNNVDTQYQGTAPFPGGSQAYDSSGYGVSVRQPIFRLQNMMQYREAKTQLRQSDIELRVAAQDLKLRVAQAYFDVLAAQDSLTFSVAQKQAIAEQLAQAKRSFEVGTTTIADTNDAQARYDLVSAQEIAATNELEIRKRALRRIIGIDPPALSPLGAELKFPLFQASELEQWQERSRQMNPGIQARQAALTLAEQEVARTRAEHLPTVDLVATYQDDTADGSALFSVGSDTTSKTVGLQLTLPLYQGGGTLSRVRETLNHRDRARENLEEATRSAAFDVGQAFFGLTNGLAQVKALEQAVASNEIALNSSKRGWEVGLRTSVDVLNSQQQLYSAKRDLALARYNTILSGLRLEAACGTLGVDDIQVVNAWLTR